jgi:hypothetical protein
MTRHGFISVVATGDQAGCDLQVRARDEQTLYEIRARFMPEGTASEIYALPNRDYQFRFYTTRDTFAIALAAMAAEITYPNFKDTLRGKLHDLASELWWVIYDHYHPATVRTAKGPR